MWYLSTFPLGLSGGSQDTAMVEEEEEEEEEAMDAALMALGGPGTAIKRRAIKLDGFGAAVAAAVCVCSATAGCSESHLIPTGKEA